MRLAFTGTQAGMTVHQLAVVKSIFLQQNPDLVGHGDCIGADTQFHLMVKEFKGLAGTTPSILIFPSTLESKRANNEGTIIYPPKPPLERNRDLVSWCDKIIAAPKETKEVMRSGTWTTIRYAKRMGKILYQVMPDGTIV